MNYHRPLHIAQIMLDRGYVKTIDEAFDRYLDLGKPAYVEKFPLSPVEAIEMIRRIGGVPVLAHPVFARADEMLPELIEMGLRGVEVYHSKHDAQTTKHYEQVAKKYGLLITGGSDSHGLEVPIGVVRIPHSLVKELKKAARCLNKRQPFKGGYKTMPRSCCGWYCTTCGWPMRSVE